MGVGGALGLAFVFSLTCFVCALGLVSGVLDTLHLLFSTSCALGPLLVSRQDPVHRSIHINVRYLSRFPFCYIRWHPN